MTDPQTKLVTATTRWWRKEITLPVWLWFLIAVICSAIHDFIKGIVNGVLS